MHVGRRESLFHSVSQVTEKGDDVYVPGQEGTPRGLSWSRSSFQGAGKTQAWKPHGNPSQLFALPTVRACGLPPPGQALSRDACSTAQA